MEIDGFIMTSLLDGLTFPAMLESVMAVEPGALGIPGDLREFVIAHADQDTVPATLMADDAPANVRLKADDGTLWQIVKRENNPGDFRVNFWLKKITANDT